jgi:glycosyltransferase involved in cell wall biosynthesis
MRDFPISVFHFSNEFVRGGAEEHMLTLLRGLDRNYFRLHLVCTPQCAERLQPDLPGDVELLPLCLQKPSQAAAALRLAQILRQRRAQILHSHMFYASLFASPIGWVCRVPVIIETPHVREQWRRGWFKSGYFVDRFVGRFVDHYVAVSKANARYLVEQKGLPAEKIVVIHNGCDLKRLEPFQPAPTGLRSSLGFGEDDPVLTVIGRLEPQKGHSVLLQALVAVHREFPSVRLVVVGEGSLRRDLESLAGALGLQDSVRFVGYQANVLDWLRLADASVLPSFYEGLPIVAIESLAAGKPMVATAVDGTPEVVLQGLTGLTVPAGDAPRLAAAIAEILRSPELRRNLGRRGRQWVEEHFSQESQIRETQHLYLAAWARQRRLTKVQAEGALPEPGEEPADDRLMRVLS